MRINMKHWNVDNKLVAKKTQGFFGWQNVLPQLLSPFFLPFVFFIQLKAKETSTKFQGEKRRKTGEQKETKCHRDTSQHIYIRYIPIQLFRDNEHIIWLLAYIVFFGCFCAYTLAPCLRNCLRMSTRNGKGAYAGVFLYKVPTRVPPRSSLLDGHAPGKSW